MSSQELSFLPASISLENISSLLQAKIPLEEFSELPFTNKTAVAAVALAGLVTYKVYEYYASVVCTMKILTPDKNIC